MRCRAHAHPTPALTICAPGPPTPSPRIVKAAEPAFAALVGSMFYAKQISRAKWLCLLPVIGGVCLASVKELDFAWAALVTASIANLFAAVKANENKKLMDTPGIKVRSAALPRRPAALLMPRAAR